MIRSILKKTPLYKPLTQLYDAINYNRSFVYTYLQLRKQTKDKSVFFFFPFYHTGGAETVHLNIVEAIQLKKIVVFTNDSANSALLESFKKQSECIEISAYIKNKNSFHYTLFHRLSIDRINNSKASAFGCHSMFFYDLLPHLHKNINTIDLLHAFTGENEPGFEKMSLPFISYLKRRISINQKTKNDLILQYEQKGIPKHELEKIEIIQNKIHNVNRIMPNKPINPFTVIYLGRNSPEKRLYLIGRIASRVKEKYPNIKTLLVGKNLESGIEQNCLEYCNFTGRIDDDTILNELYAKAHMVIITSEREGFPMIIMEGMAQGVVPITTDVGGIKEHLINNKNGFLIPNSLTEDELVTAFSEKIILMYENKDKLSELSQEAFRYAQLNFSEDKFVQAYKKLFN